MGHGAGLHMKSDQTDRFHTVFGGVPYLCIIRVWISLAGGNGLIFA